MQNFLSICVLTALILCAAANRMDSAATASIDEEDDSVVVQGKK